MLSCSARASHGWPSRKRCENSSQDMHRFLAVCAPQVPYSGRWPGVSVLSWKGETFAPRNHGHSLPTSKITQSREQLPVWVHESHLDDKRLIQHYGHVWKETLPIAHAFGLIQPCHCQMAMVRSATERVALMKMV